MDDHTLLGIPPESRLVVLPDNDGEIVHWLGVLEEILLQHQPFDEDDDPTPEGLGPDELHAVQRISMRIYAAERADTPQLYKPGPTPAGGTPGTFNYLPLRFITVLVEDLALVGKAIAHLGQALLPSGDDCTRQIVEDFARRGPGGHQQKTTDMVVEFARAHGTLDLAVDDDMRLLCSTLIRETGPVMLILDQDHAYCRYIERVLAVNLNSPFDRFLFRGQ